MSSKETLIPPQRAPQLDIPKGSTATVRVIDTTSHIFIADQSLMFHPKLQVENSVECPSYAFLISSGGHHILFDLGVRKDHENFPAPFLERLTKDLGIELHVEKNVAEILDEKSEDSTLPSSKDVEAIIWSHHHWDHTGDIGGTFPKTTALVVGPGFKQEYTPGYPTNPNSALFESDWEGRSFSEIDFAEKGISLRIGRLGAYDYFGDGSFYLLNAPGHTVGHICGLARVSCSPDSFILMGADASHNVGEMRPNQYHPIPKTIKPSPLPKYASVGCPGELIRDIHPKKSASEPLYTPAPGFNVDDDEAIATIEKLIELDASAGVLVILSHDKALHPELPYFPKSINDWFELDLDEKTRWCFLQPLGEALESATGK